ncbi:hypothetical protein C8F04DRAFT_1405618 [Mycena alexandri]|uniref:Uncharacterized protein n=1 Tax=Mycena alexandri TaxID=1745969 RepID=A0AAD6RZA1_9AGAR|nr:hypothetical protein C8F04DRAFT_1405618 [Mycena alexandri]
MSSNLSISSKGPPTVLRTPARTKRRSVSSIPSSDPSSLGLEEVLTEEDGEETEILTPDVPASLPSTQSGGNNATFSFASLLSAPAPVILSTPLEHCAFGPDGCVRCKRGSVVMVRRGRERRVLEGVSGEGIVTTTPTSARGAYIGAAHTISVELFSLSDDTNSAPGTRTHSPSRARRRGCSHPRAGSWYGPSHRRLPLVVQHRD